MKDALNAFLGLFGFTIVRTRALDGLLATARAQHRYRVRTSDLESFFRSIRPVRTEHELIRLGGARDGGYLVPDDLDGIAACLSPGVGDSSSFERDLASRGIPSWLYDDTVDGPPLAHPLLRFEKMRLGAHRRPGAMSIDAWVESCLPAGQDALLQMDIEGDEYEILMSVSDDALKRFRILLVEFHFMGSLFSNLFLRQARHVFERLAAGFELVHLHPNNAAGTRRHLEYEVPEVMEMTFLRKDRARNARPLREFPHPLDEDNVAESPSILLPTCWYEKGSDAKRPDNDP